MRCPIRTCGGEFRNSSGYDLYMQAHGIEFEMVNGQFTRPIDLTHIEPYVVTERRLRRTKRYGGIDWWPMVSIRSIPAAGFIAFEYLRLSRSEKNTSDFSPCPHCLHVAANATARSRHIREQHEGTTHLCSQCQHVPFRSIAELVGHIKFTFPPRALVSDAYLQIVDKKNIRIEATTFTCSKTITSFFQCAFGASVDRWMYCNTSRNRPAVRAMATCPAKC
ncbi:hypothetical protein BC940DRAFT_335060 [Gongronella butleri]|nr:hypothetical protein BC940DRAFT_335060 [Gongronella butleri]